MKTTKIGVRFCGNCNPAIDAAAVLKEIRLAMPDIDQCPPDSPEMDVLIIINGCRVDCASRPDWAGKTITIAGESVDYAYCAQANIAAKVCERIKTIKCN